MIASSNEEIEDEDTQPNHPATHFYPILVALMTSSRHRLR